MKAAMKAPMKAQMKATMKAAMKAAMKVEVEAVLARVFVASQRQPISPCVAKQDATEGNVPTRAHLVL